MNNVCVKPEGLFLRLAAPGVELLPHRDDQTSVIRWEVSSNSPVNQAGSSFLWRPRLLTCGNVRASVCRGLQMWIISVVTFIPLKKRWEACLPRRAGFKKQNSFLIQIDRRVMIWYRFTERQIQVDFLPHNSYKIRKSYCESLLCLSFVCGRPLLTAVGAEHRSRKGNLETAFIESRSVFIQGCTFLKPFN